MRRASSSPKVARRSPGAGSGPWLLAALLTGCIGSPNVVLLDRKTVLEEQASGELVPLENELRERAVVPRGQPMTRAELAEAGAGTDGSPLDQVVAIHALMTTEAEYLDELLTRRCVGEARSGLLVETPSSCTGAVRERRTSAAVQRVNRGRRQLWRYLVERRPGRTEIDIRRAWRRHHLEAIVCGAQYEDEAGQWVVKEC